MDYFERLNKKMDAGWKLTDKYCSKCQVAYLVDPEQTKLLCAHCGLEKDLHSQSRVSRKDSGNQFCRFNLMTLYYIFIKSAFDSIFCCDSFFIMDFDNFWVLIFYFNFV